jgi:hypothetical protein
MKKTSQLEYVMNACYWLNLFYNITPDSYYVNDVLKDANKKLKLENIESYEIIFEKRNRTFVPCEIFK